MDVAARLDLPRSCGVHELPSFLGRAVLFSVVVLVATGRVGADMKLIVTKEFEKTDGQPLKPGACYKEVDLSSNAPIGTYSKGINPAYYNGGVNFSKVVVEKLTKAICDVQPMTKHGPVPTEMDFSTILNKSVVTLRDVYSIGVWGGHKPGQKLITVPDFENMFEFLTYATVYYVNMFQGVNIEDYLKAACQAISITISELIEPCVEMNIAGQFDRSLLVEAVYLRACGDESWLMVWNKFMSKITFHMDASFTEYQQPNGSVAKAYADALKVTSPDRFFKKLAEAEIFDNTEFHPVHVKCDEENNTPEDIKQGKLNVNILAPPAEHIDVSFVLDSDGNAIANAKKTVEADTNQPVPCDPPSLVVEAKKVPVVDKHGKEVVSPGKGWWIGDDFCWHPPFTKEQKKYASDLITAFQPAVLGQLPNPAETKCFITSYTPLYTTPSIVLEDIQKKIAHDLHVYGSAVVDKVTGKIVDPTKVAVSLGGHGTIGPGGKVEGLKFDGAWAVPAGVAGPVTGPNLIAKSAPYAPMSIDDVASGFKAGDVWYNSSGGILYRCAICTLGSAVWYVIAQVTPTSEGPKIIVTDKPKHLVDGPFDVTFDKFQPGKPVNVTYVDTSDQPDLQASFSPEAEKDLQQAMVQAIKDGIDKDIAKTIIDCPDTVDVVVTEVGQPNKNGNVYGESCIHKMVSAHKAMSDMAYMQEKLNQALNIPPHLLHGPVQNTK